MEALIYPLGDQALTIEVEDKMTESAHEKIQQISAYLDQHPPEWLIEYIPAFTTVTLFYRPMYFYRAEKGDIWSQVIRETRRLLSNVKGTSKRKMRKIEIPVCYGGELGPDLPFAARHNHLTEQEVIDRHTGGDYLVYMIGFAPGFPYMGGMDSSIAAPRKEEPRTQIPAGSVGIAGDQTGVYPISTPGGWQIIGQTPLPLFKPEEDPPSLLQAGDRIKFTAISPEEFNRIRGECQ